MNENTLIEVKNVKKYFSVKPSIFSRQRKIVKAVDDVSFTINRGETFGLVGESGCGKSTLGRTITRLYDPTDGSILFRNVDISSLHSKEMQAYRKKMQMIFQDPYSSLNPYMNVEEIIGEPMDIHMKLGKKEKLDKMIEILGKVGLKKEDLEKFPYEFSGGQRQRIGIARALSVNPEFILADEAISALDVSIQAQVINLLEDLQEEMGLTYLFVAHDLSMVKHISDRIGVMYLGKIVEVSPSTELYKKPLHPYTQALLSAIPIPDPRLAKEAVHEPITGELPSPLDLPSGCRFRTRCPFATATCAEVEPELKKVAKDQYVACHLYE
ncbi:ABC transporter ATP-binding protein [Peribacillus alkalitolerans]|uniref:ABC transporter ATP-binding protein n=1 Tax=Peribacillus alkalitolerans TaxID=1550385 RepID=UPI0013D65AE8|nr:ABC transporter ATP-binding protein [Peribacillus alkalitolerans]